MNKRTVRKRDVLILSLTIAIFAALIVFCVFKWHLIIDLLNHIVTGKTLVREYVQSLGIAGEAAITVVIIACFFFPVISSLPLQIVCVMAYGVWHATLLISFAIALASQILFLVERSFKVFCYTPKQRKKQEEIEECIKSSKRSIHAVMILLYIVPCIPFLIISSVASRSNMSWKRYTLYTALGPIPEVLVTLILGNRLTSNSSPVASFIVFFFMIALVILSLVFKDQLIYFIFNPPRKARGRVKK